MVAFFIRHPFLVNTHTRQAPKQFITDFLLKLCSFQAHAEIIEWHLIHFLRLVRAPTEP